MSGCWALVPIKRLFEAKQRLSLVLSPTARAKLVRAMLSDVLAVIRETNGLAGIAVVTSDPRLVPVDALWISDPGTGLNGAIAAAAVELERRGATSMLIIPADVPFVTVTEIEALLAASREASVVMASDRARRGTNALLLTPPRLFDTHFGEDSLQKHIAGARATGQVAHIHDCPGLAFDIDRPQDLDELTDTAATAVSLDRWLNSTLSAVLGGVRRIG